MYTDIAESGQVIAQLPQAIQSSALSALDGLYPFTFIVLMSISRTFLGQTLTHNPHPLQMD